MKKRFLAAVLMMCVSVCAFAGCGEKKAAETVDLTSVDLDTIIEKAKEEGAISSVGMPDDWRTGKEAGRQFLKTMELPMMIQI